MPSLRITIENTSPIISYSPGWRAGHSSDDPSADQYSQSSFTLTNTTGATASFSFNGTSVDIFGAKRSNHGGYQVKLDSKVFPTDSGKVSPDIFQTPLFSTNGLSQGLHTVTLINQEESYLDIDFITWETIVGTNSSGDLFVNTIQDTSPSFTYLPLETDWGVLSKNIGSFMGGSGHATAKPGASLIYNFDGKGPNITDQNFASFILSGESVSLYGSVGPDGSPFSVHVDGGSSSSYTTVQEFYTPQSLLYHASSLEPGSHNLTLVYQPNSPQQTLAVDYAVVFTTAAPLAAPTLGHDTGGLTSIAKGALAGLGASIALLLVLSGVLLKTFWRRRHGIKANHAETSQYSYRYNATTSTAGAPSQNTLTTYTASPTSHTTPDRGIFHKSRYGFVNHRRNKENASAMRSTSGSDDSSPTQQSPSSIVHIRSPAPSAESPPQYTED